MENEGADTPVEEAAGLPKKKGGRLWLTVVGALVVASASSAAGATFGPVVKQKIMGAPHAPPKEGAEEEAEPENDKEKGNHIAPLDPLVIDVRDESGDNHHVKIGIALEVAGELHEEEWKVEVVPKVRDASIAYLRSLHYEEAANSAKFETIRTELQERISKAVKKPKVRKVFFVDFVVQ